MGRRRQETTPRQAARLNKLAGLLRGAKAEKLRSALVKSATLSLRLTPAEKADMEATAKRLGLTLTEYLERIHALVSARLKD